VRRIDEETAKELLNKTKDADAEKIRVSTGIREIGKLLDSVREIDEETARELIDKTKDTYAEKIVASTDPFAIGWRTSQPNKEYVCRENKSRHGPRGNRIVALQYGMGR
jgi:3-deoxy-D-arabino-heptulosonate 7-phosphate (DAHP) synthase